MRQRKRTREKGRRREGGIKMNIEEMRERGREKSNETERGMREKEQMGYREHKKARGE
jgi:hypothetical protein